MEENFLAQSMDMQRIKKTLTLSERIAVIQQYEKTPNARFLARIYGCGRTQIQNILRHKDQYIEDWTHRGDPTRLRRRFSAPLMALNMVVYEWVRRSRGYNISLDDEAVRKIAEETALLLKFKAFRSNNRWLERFKMKFRISNLDMLEYEVTDVLSLNLESIITDIQNEFGQILLPEGDRISTEHIAALKKFENKWVQQAKDQIMISSSQQPERKKFKLSLKTNWMDNNSSDMDNSFSDWSYSQETENLEATKSSYLSNGVHSKEIKSWEDALNHLRPLEEFALYGEKIRAIGLINQLENLIMDEMKQNKS